MTMNADQMIENMYEAKRSVTRQIKDFLLNTVDVDPKIRLEKVKEMIEVLEDSWK